MNGDTPAQVKSPTPELEAFLDVLTTVTPGALTTCPGLVVHHMAAHVAGGYSEATRHIEGYLEGRPVMRTRTFDEREPVYRALSIPDLIRIMREDEAVMIDAVHRAGQLEPDAKVHWTNRYVRIDSFVNHLKIECALHRWDIVGGDSTGSSLLSGIHLLNHTVKSVTAPPLTARGRAGGTGRGRNLRATLRADGQPDVLVTVCDGDASLRLIAPEGDALLVSDPEARLLMMWGRRPHPPSRVVCHGSYDEAARVQRLFAGY